VTEVGGGQASADEKRTERDEQLYSCPYSLVTPRNTFHILNLLFFFKFQRLLSLFHYNSKSIKFDDNKICILDYGQVEMIQREKAEIYYLFIFAVLGFELRAYTLNHSTSSFFVMVFFSR
jgi:hypothetical protein